MARRTQDFQTIRSEGGLLPQDLLRRVLDPHSGLPGTTAEDYHLAPGERLNEVITQSWNRLRRHWDEFRQVAANLPAGAAGTGLTNDKWSLPLLRELGFGFLPVTAGPELDGRTFPIRRFTGPVPIHLVGCGLSLDRRAAGQHGAAAANPHGLVQEFLNRSGAHLWAVVSNGLRLRVLRDNQALSRQSFLDFDLEAMFSGEVYSDFVLLWLMVHATRFMPSAGDRPETCRLEQWTQEAERIGTRALGDLRRGVERALAILGAGFTGHPKNEALREALRSGSLTPTGLHEQLLRVVYRLIFLFVAEDRTLDGSSLLHPPDDSATARIARERYAEHYGTARLRRLAGRIKGSRHVDLWRQFRSLVGPLSGDRRSAPARRHLALPALGSFLWDPASTAALNDTELTNYDFLEALRHLAYTRQDKMLRPVDYHNLGAEELGGVYESLLALTPQVNGGGGHFSFAEFTGNRRKTSGSYYTPDALVQCLLDSALDPVVEAAVTNKTGVEAEQAILDLKVCDPAVGSGHFLVGAAHRLARHLARVRAYADGESEPSPLLYQRALRDVIGRCLYGVDVNPMAAELCRVGLWLEALEPGKPLSFLDRHIRVGNSLLGATPELIEAGLPDSAFKPIQGDDKKSCSELRKRNKTEREYGQRDLGLVAESEEEYDSMATRSRSIDHAPDGTLEDIRRKDAQFRRMQESEDYRHGQQVADAWCAAFVWPKRPGEADALTTDTLRRLRENSNALAPAQREETERIAERFQFFHWYLAFPEVFANGGFDCMLGNPPWERVKIQEKEWFEARNLKIANAPNAATRKRLIGKLRSDDPVMYRAFVDALHVSSGISHLLRSSGRYPMCGRGDINSYAVFAETMRSLANDQAAIGSVLSTGIASDDTTKLYFQDVIQTRALVSLLAFDNKRGIFPAVKRSQRFCLLTLRGKSISTTTPDFMFYARDVSEIHDSVRRFSLTLDDFSLLNPNTQTCPVFRTKRDAELTIAIYRRVSSLLSESSSTSNLWNAKFLRMLDMANDSDVFLTPSQIGDATHLSRVDLLPLYEAKMFAPYDHRARTYHGGRPRELTSAEKLDPYRVVMPRYWVKAEEVNERLKGRWERKWALCWQDVTDVNTMARTANFGIIPLVGIGHTAPMFLSDTDPSLVAALQANLTSFVFDYVARQKIGGVHLTYQYLKQLPVVSPGMYLKVAPWVGSSILVFIVERVLELTYTAHDLMSFAHDCGYNGPPFRWDDERRFLMQCELDAAFFYLYLPTESSGEWRLSCVADGYAVDESLVQFAGLKAVFPTPRSAVSHVMDTFTVVRSKDERRYGEFRTKRVILDIYDAMQGAAATGEAYRTVLDPPPADRSCCHTPRVAVPNVASLPEGEWARAEGDQTGSEIAVLAAVLKAIDGPAPMRTIRLTALLAMDPQLLTASLSLEDATQWLRLVGPEVAALDSPAVPPQPANSAWGQAVQQLRGTGLLIENLAAGTWASGPGLDAIRTEGWPDGRVGMVMRVLSQRAADEVVRTLPANFREWIDAEAA